MTNLGSPIAAGVALRLTNVQILLPAGRAVQ